MSYAPWQRSPGTWWGGQQLVRQRLVVAAGGLLRKEVAEGAAGEPWQRSKALQQAQPHLSFTFFCSDPQSDLSMLAYMPAADKTVQLACMACQQDGDAPLTSIKSCAHARTSIILAVMTAWRS